MRSYQELIRAISVRWIIKNALRAVIYCLNPFRLIKWFFYFVFGVIALGMLTLAIGNYATAAEWVPAQMSDRPATSLIGSCSGTNVSLDGCISYLKSKYPTSSNHEIQFCSMSGSKIRCQIRYYYSSWITFYWTSIENASFQYKCPPTANPEFTMGPIVNANGTVCEKKPVQCLLGSVKDTNTITGKEFCRPICEGIAGNTYGDADNLVSYFTSTFGSVKIQCYGQCSVSSVGTAINTGANPNIWMGIIKFTGENCPIQTQGTEEDTSTAGANTPVTPPDSSAATNDAQNQLQNAASSAISNTVSGATGTASLNTVVDKLAETSNAQIKASSEQNAALGKVIQNTGKDIQASIKEAQLSASQGGAGASTGQIQTANAIKDGNAQLGTKLDAIKDAIEESNDDGEGEVLPPGNTDINTDPNDVNPNPNDWGSRNYSTVMQHHVTAMNGLPLFSSIGDFFQVDMGAGTCPSFSIDVPEVGGVGGGSIVFDVFCNADLQRIFEIIALCVKLLGLYVAFRIALLD
ncbi:hypothetical protein [Aeromonas salmonicida]|uniref:hypothetical protein n=1 Tax=Aeromonas salmonicida TaxID=645 RepID=UPI001BAC9201|nr:hypothetical protein [Aeromonas salmonicida]MBS2781143.1 hypothetical protein [Aeromonas salmonicida]